MCIHNLITQFKYALVFNHWQTINRFVYARLKIDIVPANQHLFSDSSYFPSHFSFQEWAKSTIRTSCIRMKQKPPIIPIHIQAVPKSPLGMKKAPMMIPRITRNLKNQNLSEEKVKCKFINKIFYDWDMFIKSRTQLIMCVEHTACINTCTIYAHWQKAYARPC